jgi:hypothetical protein
MLDDRGELQQISLCSFHATIHHTEGYIMKIVTKYFTSNDKPKTAKQATRTSSFRQFASAAILMTLSATAFAEPHYNRVIISPVLHNTHYSVPQVYVEHPARYRGHARTYYSRYTHHTRYARPAHNNHGLFFNKGHKSRGYRW